MGMQSFLNLRGNGGWIWFVHFCRGKLPTVNTSDMNVNSQQESWYDCQQSIVNSFCFFVWGWIRPFFLPLSKLERTTYLTACPTLKKKESTFQAGRLGVWGFDKSCITVIIFPAFRSQIIFPHLKMGGLPATAAACLGCQQDGPHGVVGEPLFDVTPKHVEVYFLISVYTCFF